MITLKNGPFHVEVEEDNSLYPYLSRMVGMTLSITDSSAQVEEKEPSKKSKLIKQEPSMEDFINERSEVNGAKVKTVKHGNSYDTVGYTVNVNDIFTKFNKEFLADTATRTILHSHIEKVVGSKSQTSACVPVIEELSTDNYIMLTKAGNYLFMPKDEVGATLEC